MKKIILDINAILPELKEKTIEEVVSYYKQVFDVQVILVDARKQNLGGSSDLNGVCKVI